MREERPFRKHRDALAGDVHMKGAHLVSAPDPYVMLAVSFQGFRMGMAKPVAVSRRKQGDNRVHLFQESIPGRCPAAVVRGDQHCGRQPVSLPLEQFAFT